MIGVRDLISRTIATAALAAAVGVLATPAQAQRLSLAERVDRLEQQATQGNSGGAVDLVNQLSALQSQVQSLQGQVEELKHALDEANRRNKDQYIDLDSRIGRLEGGSVSAAPPVAGGGASRNTPQPPDVDLGNPGGGMSAPDRRTTPPAGGDLTIDDRAAGTMPPEPGNANPPGNAAAVYNEAFAALKDGRYAESARRFQGFIEQYPDNDLTGNAYYWLGESYYVTQNYKIAEESFRTLLTRFPDSQKAPDALLKIGYTQYEQKQWSEAEATLNRVVQTYPGTTVARLAEGRLRALKTDSQR